MLVRKITRRAVLRQGMNFTLAGAAAVGLGACDDSEERQLGCNEPGQLSDSDLSTRTSLGYVDVSGNPAETCRGCEYFAAGSAADSCGGCQFLPGQVSSEGRCNSWSAKS